MGRWTTPFKESFLCVRPESGDTGVLDDFQKEFADIGASNLVLFGDPWTNPLIAKVLPKLPVRWTKEQIELDGKTYPAVGRRVLMIYPNPLNPQRYVVLNSGQTFTGPQGYVFSSWLLYPRLANYAVVNAATDAPDTFGYFDKNWRLVR